MSGTNTNETDNRPLNQDDRAAIDASIYNVSSVIDSELPITTQTFSYTAVHADSIGIYISLKTFMRWDDRFIKIYKVVGGVRAPIPFGACTGINNLDVNRQRFANGELDTGQSYLVNVVSFSAGVDRDDQIEVDYTESQILHHKMSLVPMGWDFDNNKPYGGTGTDWSSVGQPASEIYSKSIPVKVQGGNATLTNIGNFVNRVTVPSYLPTTYAIVGQTEGKEIWFLVQNVLVDQLAPLDFDYSSLGLRVEAFQFPKKQRNEYGGTKSLPYGKFNYIGYWTTNLMKVTDSLSIGNQCNSIMIGFRLRNMNTNSVSNWLPIKLFGRRGFRPAKTVVLDDRKQSVLLRYEF